MCVKSRSIYGMMGSSSVVPTPPPTQMPTTSVPAAEMPSAGCSNVAFIIYSYSSALCVGSSSGGLVQYFGFRGGSVPPGRDGAALCTTTQRAKYCDDTQNKNQTKTTVATERARPQTKEEAPASASPSPYVRMRTCTCVQDR